MVKYRIMVGLVLYRMLVDGHICIVITQVWASCWLWGIPIMVARVFSQLKPTVFSILSCRKKHRPSASPFFTTKNVKAFNLHPLRKYDCVRQKHVACDHNEGDLFTFHCNISNNKICSKPLNMCPPFYTVFV